MGQEVLEVSNRNIELPSSTFKSDQVFNVSLKDGRKILLHLEFEAHDKAEDMVLSHARISCSTRLDVSP
ncbi:MAG: hypothetical protein R2865_05475 [Deinococcales bacterium]